MMKPNFSPSLLRLVFFAAIVCAASLARAQAVTPESLIRAGEHEAARAAATGLLSLDEGDAGARFQRARASAFLGEYESALADYDSLLGRYPANVDYVFGRSQVLGYMGRDREALVAADRAIGLAPDYEAIWQHKSRLMLRLGESGLDEFRASAAVRFPDADWWRPRAEAPVAGDYRRTLTVGGDTQELSGSLPGWSSAYAELAWQAGPRQTYLLRMLSSRRFSTGDLALGAGAEFRIGDSWFAGLELNAASDADFLASSDYSGHAGRILGDGWSLDLRYRRREFETATVSAWTTTVDKYFGNFRAAYSLSLARLHGATDSLGHVATLNWYQNENHSYGITLATGEEAEVVAPGQILQTDVSAVSVSGRHRLSTRWGLSWFAGTHEQGDFYRRRYVGLAVSFRF